MSTALEAYVNARENALRCALDSLRAERRLIDDDGSIPMSSAADAALCFAARQLDRAVEELPQSRRPKGWDQ